MIILKAASYERVSSDEQVRAGFSLEAQNEKNINYIKLQGWEFAGSYIDPGKSGKNLNRPDMKRLLSDINKGLINIVVVHKLDRLTRNIGDLHHLLNLFEKKEIKLVSLTENIDTSNAMGRMFVYLLGVFAQLYRENLSEEVIKGQSKRAEKGLRNSSHRPLGYEVRADDLSLSIIEEEAALVREIFSLFIGGWGVQKIARHFNTSGIPSKTNGRWYERTIVSILTNHSYYGATHWKPKDAPEEERIIVPDMHEPIISKETFDEAQRVAKRRSELSMNTSGHDFPFSTIVKCGECGRSYHGYDQKYKKVTYNTRHYRCAGKYAADHYCTNGSDISEPKLSAAFLEFLDNIDIHANDPNKLLEGRDVDRERKKLQRLLEDSAAKRKNYTRAMGSGKIDYDTFEELIDEENKKAKEWQDQLDALSAFTPSKRTRKDILELINNLKSKWAEMDHAKRKFAVQQLFEVLVIKKYDKEWRIVSYKLAE